MKLLSWNIQRGGGARLPGIFGSLVAHEPDVILLTEFRSQPGAILCENLRAAGWPYAVSTNPTGIDNGICAISRTPLAGKRPCPAPLENTARWLDIDLPECGFGIGALHIVCSRLKDGFRGLAKTRFWNAVLGAAAARLQEPFLFLGDFNTGAHRLDEAGKTFVCAEHFGKLSELGWKDMWRHHNNGPTEWTWYSKQKGGAPCNGFRLDHAFATPSLAPRINACRYSHAERISRISDHSILTVTTD